MHFDILSELKGYLVPHCILRVCFAFSTAPGYKQYELEGRI